MTAFIRKNTRPKKTPPKGVVPPQLMGKGFDAHPENRNKNGAPKTAIALRQLITEMAGETIEVEVGTGKDKKKVQMTRLERLLLEFFETSSARKQEMLLGYGYGKPAETLEVKGELKVIKVSLKKPQEQDTGDAG